MKKMKKNILFFLVAAAAVTTNGCGAIIRVGSIPTSTTAEVYSVVVDNQTSEPATLIIDGSESRSIPASQVTKMSMRRNARLFIVKFGDGKSFSRQMNTNWGDMVIITISSNRRGNQVRFDRSSDNRRYNYNNYYYDDYRYRYYRPYYYR